LRAPDPRVEVAGAQRELRVRASEAGGERLRELVAEADLAELREVAVQQEVVHRLRVRVRADRVAVEVVPGRVDDVRDVVEGPPRGRVVLDRRAEGPVTRRTDAQPETRQGEARPDSARLGRVRRHGLARLRVPDQAAGLAVVQPVTVRVDRLGHVAYADRVAD